MNIPPVRPVAKTRPTPECLQIQGATGTFSSSSGRTLKRLGIRSAASVQRPVHSDQSTLSSERSAVPAALGESPVKSILREAVEHAPVDSSAVDLLTVGRARRCRREAVVRT